MVNVTIKLTDQQWEQLYYMAYADESLNDTVQKFVNRELARLFLERKDGE
jgi:hypothetical protein